MKKATQKAIAENLDALRRLLNSALSATNEAVELIAEGDHAAIGTIVELEQILPDATALHGAAIALHRHRSG